VKFALIPNEVLYLEFEAFSVPEKDKEDE
jgi:hypothetical protein